ncbi:MAG: ACT domain-containing protein, partial [bacterium]
MNRAIITVMGLDHTGIVAGISSVLADFGVN